MDERRTYHCDLCDRDLKGSHQYNRHLESKPHKKVVRSTYEDFNLHLKLVGFNSESSGETAKILKNTFNIGLSDVMEKMKCVPSDISVISSKGGGLAKVTNQVKELAKHGIKVTFTRHAVDSS